MNRFFDQLRPGDRSAIDSAPDGLLLVRVDRADYRRQAQKPFYQVRFTVLEPRHLAGCVITPRLYCTERAMWKLRWFLRDFGYDPDLLSRGEVDDRALRGLRGVLKVSYATVKGIFYLNVDAFAPAEKWNELSPLAADEHPGSEVA
jgi:hypothetical protein